MKNENVKKEVLGNEAKQVNELDELTPINETMYDNLREPVKMNDKKAEK